MAYMTSDLEPTACCICSGKKSSLLLRVDGLRVVRCIRCSLVYVNPRFSQKKLQQLYDSEYFSGSGKRYFEDTWRNYYFKPVIRELIEFTGQKKGKILDVGTAGGHFIKSLKDCGFNVYGVEPSVTASEFARKQLKLDVKTGDLLSVKYPKRFFDVVTMNDVIEHTINPRENLVRIHSFLKPGGWLMLSTPNIDSLGFRVFQEGFVFMVPQVHLWYFNPETLSLLLHQTGFTVRKIVYPFFETPFFNPKEILRLVVNVVRKTLLTPGRRVPSAPWYGNVLKIYAQKI